MERRLACDCVGTAMSPSGRRGEGGGSGEGGGCLRVLQLVRQVSGLKLAWKLVKGGTLWSEWMRNRYFKGGSFWNYSYNNNDSVSFKSLLRLRPLLKRNMYLVFRDVPVFRDDATTDMWIDPWLDQKCLMERVGEQLHAWVPKGMQVAHILQQGRWRPEIYR